MPSNIDALIDDIKEFPDSCVELYNATDAPVDIKGWYVSDNISNRRKWKIDTTLVIQAKGYMILYLDEYDTLQLHVNFELDIDGGALFLTGTDGITTNDSIISPKMTPNFSYGCTTDCGSKHAFKLLL